MQRIVAVNTSLASHFAQLAHAPEVYRPLTCPHCGCGNPWRHGFYPRKADRRAPAGTACNPVPVARFSCRACRRTCSRLPLCMAPRRWHPWAEQQRVLLALLADTSLRQASLGASVSRHTIRRWWNWLHERSTAFSFILCSRFPELGRSGTMRAFWQGCLAAMPLAEAMAWVDRETPVP